MPTKKIDRSSAYAPPAWDEADARALQRLAAGDATPEQQKRALNWIIHSACLTYDFPFRPGGAEGARETDLALGRQFAGQQIVKLVKIDLLALQQNAKKEN